MKKFVIALNVLFIIIGLFAALMALTSPMLFDASGSENNKILYVTFISIIILPFACLSGVFFSLRAIVKLQQPKKALKILLIPLFVLVVFLGSLEAIDVFCAGLFSC